MLNLSHIKMRGQRGCMKTFAALPIPVLSRSSRQVINGSMLEESNVNVLCAKPQ